jgi:group I intron endonuclease
MSYGYIYKTTNLINGRLYIGQRKGTFTPEYLGSGKIIKIAIKQYGKNNFRLEVLAFATTYQMLNGLEMKYIYEYRQIFGDRFLYNITDGGGGSSGRIFSEESKKKMRLSWIGRKPKILSDDHKKKIGLSQFGKKLSEEHRKNLSLGMKGKKHKPMSEETKNKLRLANIGKKLSDEHKRKVGEGNKGRKLSDDSKNKIRQAKLKYWKETRENGSYIAIP